MESKNPTKQLVLSSLIAAAYAALTYASAGFAYGGIQFRLSEALNILAVFTPAAIPGLTVGCLIGNIGSPFGIADMVFGTMATCLSAIMIRIISSKAKKRVPCFCIIPPVILNSAAVGAEIALFTPGDSAAAAFFLSALSVGIGEAAVTGILGTALYFTIKKYVRC